MLEMTQAEFARYRGCYRQAISKGIKAGKIPKLPNGKIDAAAADGALGGTRERIDVSHAGAPVVGYSQNRVTNPGQEASREPSPDRECRGQGDDAQGPRTGRGWLAEGD